MGKSAWLFPGKQAKFAFIHYNWSILSFLCADWKSHNSSPNTKFLRNELARCDFTYFPPWTKSCCDLYNEVHLHCWQVLYILWSSKCLGVFRVPEITSGNTITHLKLCTAFCRTICQRLASRNVAQWNIRWNYERAFRIILNFISSFVICIMLCMPREVSSHFILSVYVDVSFCV